MCIRDSFQPLNFAPVNTKDEGAHLHIVSPKIPNDMEKDLELRAVSYTHLKIGFYMIFHNCTLYNFVLRYKYKVEIAFSEKTSAIIRQKRMHKS